MFGRDTSFSVSSSNKSPILEIDSERGVAFVAAELLDWAGRTHRGHWAGKTHASNARLRHISPKMAESELPIEITTSSEPSNADREAILRPLLAYNQASGGPSKYEPVAIMLRDTINGNSLGSLWGKLYYDWLFVELLFVPDYLRGADYGSGLLSRAEDLARQKGCVGIWLDTHSFQAPAFYPKQGYERFGTLDDYPRGAKRFFFRKLLNGASSL